MELSSLLHSFLTTADGLFKLRRIINVINTSLHKKDLAMLKKIMLVALVPLLGVYTTSCMDLVEQPKLEIVEDAVDTAAFYAYGKIQAELYKASLSGDYVRKMKLVESIDIQG